MRATRASETLIDNYLTNDAKLLNRSKTYIIRNSITDHYPILVDMLCYKESTQISRQYHMPRTQLILNDVTKPILQQKLYETNWDSIISTQCCASNFANFYQTYQNIVESALTAPVNVHPSPTRPWYNASHHEAIVERNRLYQRYKRYKRNPSEDRWETYVTSRNRVKSLLRK